MNNESSAGGGAGLSHRRDESPSFSNLRILASSAELEGAPLSRKIPEYRRNVDGGAMPRSSETPGTFITAFTRRFHGASRHCICNRLGSSLDLAQ